MLVTCLKYIWQTLYQPMKNISSIKTVFALSAFAVASFVSSCKNEVITADNVKAESLLSVKLADQSITPPLIKKLAGFESLDVYSLLSSDDVLSESPNFVFGGSADGSGTIKNPNGKGYFMLINNEDNYAVSKITLNEDFKPVKGEYVLNSDAGQWRLCSGTLATPKVNGFGPLYLSCGESDVEGQTHAIDPITNVHRTLPGLGHWSAENAVPLDKNAYAGQTVIVLGEDASDATGGQLVMYKSTTVGDLDNGDEYMLRRTDLNQKETDMVAGTSYDVEFVKIPNHKTLTGAQIQALVNPLSAIKFGRVEDVDFRKGSSANSREIYFNVTGQAAIGVNADHSRTVHGRTYKLLLNKDDATKGKLVCILDGDDDNGPANQFQNPDNICVVNNFVYIQEDANSYGDETHDAYIYQYCIDTKILKVVFELDHKRDNPKFKADAAKGNWEYGSLVDISDVVKIPNTFSLAIQPHTWRDAKFKGVDGGLKRVNENQGSQIVIIKGLQK